MGPLQLGGVAQGKVKGKGERREVRKKGAGVGRAQQPGAVPGVQNQIHNNREAKYTD